MKIMNPLGKATKEIPVNRRRNTSQFHLFGFGRQNLKFRILAEKTKSRPMLYLRAILKTILESLVLLTVIH
jgi:hypothetical protein